MKLKVQTKGLVVLPLRPRYWTEVFACHGPSSLAISPPLLTCALTPGVALRWTGPALTGDCVYKYSQHTAKIW